mmetsp:Transcript_23568/g.25998  ORF Transcript_23568/g.25998 Transcript_23568/m.25998 type:complete len:858 (-) Transcript_23568:101-2674(-)
MTDISDESLFGLTLTTLRDKDTDATSPSFFQYECIIASIAVCFFRMTIKSYEKEPLPLRLVFALSLASLAYFKKPYEIICAVQLFSYAVPLVLMMSVKRIVRTSLLPAKLMQLLLLVLSAVLSLALSHVALSENFFTSLANVTPTSIQNIFFYFFPAQEIIQAYETIAAFVDEDILNKQIAWLLFVTFNVQCGLGFLGIEFLTREQKRRNELIRLDMINENESSENDTLSTSKSQRTNGVKTETMNGNGIVEKQSATPKKRLNASRRFQRGAAPFILFSAAPYMFQLIAFGNMNFFAYTCFEHDVHRAVRLNQLFDHDSHLVAMANDSATPPQAYAASIDIVVSTTYGIFNRKFFSLPKLMLLPGIIMRQPILMAKLTPFIFGSDYFKARVMSFLTTKIEKFNKDATEIDSIRSKVEAFDLKNAELLQRSGTRATKFTHKRWEDLTAGIQQKNFMADFLLRTKRFFNWIQHHFIFSVIIDCALAHLIAIGKIASAEIFVFSRAIEDAVDTVLMRSRAESELARMSTNIDKLKNLSDVWELSRERSLLPCSLASESDQDPGIILRNLQYSRGSASVNIDYTKLTAGVYALTGANGSGKSTLFRVLMSCKTNEKVTDLPTSITFSSPGLHIQEEENNEPDNSSCGATDESCKLEKKMVEEDINNNDSEFEIIMPSSNVAEISQTFYWPLYTRPIDWMYQDHLTNEDVVLSESLKVAGLLQELEFRQVKNKENGTEVVNTPTAVVAEELREKKEDWFNDLSGGQKSKVELVRKIFLQEHCPSVLLIDETMAPLDPSSKSLVMSKLKDFCRKSIIIVIYHTDVRENSGNDDGRGDECVPSNNFFDENIHLQNHTLVKRSLC